MRHGKIPVNDHAQLRMSQRNIGFDDVEVVRRFARLLYRSGAEFYFLAARDLPAAWRLQCARLVGTTLVVEGETLTTVYRNRRALRRIKRKIKYRRAV